MCQKFSGPSGKAQGPPLNKNNDRNTQILTISKIVDLCDYCACFFIVCVVIRLPSQFWLLNRRNKALGRPNSYSYFFNYFLFAKTSFATTNFYSKENAKSTWEP
jgi:hypothetical protein